MPIKFFIEADADFDLKQGYSFGLVLGQKKSFDSSMTVISIDKANLLLEERGKVVYTSNPSNNYPDWCGHLNEDAQHKALLICVEPIEVDSAEKVLSEIVKEVDHWTDVCRGSPLIERARKLLTKGEK